MKVNYPYLCSDRDRHGNVRIYYRRKGRKVRLRATPGTTEFQLEYDAARGPREASRALPDTYRGLVVRYINSAEFNALDASTQRQKRRVLESTCLEPFAPGSNKVMAECPLKSFGRQHVRMLRDRKAAHPEAARHRLKTLSQMFDWALENDIEGVTANPVKQVKYPKPSTGGGHHTWSVAEKERFEQRHPVGTKARLAFALMYYTGLRVSDIVRVGHEHLQRDGSIKIRLHKNRNRSPVVLQLPIIPELEAIMSASQIGLTAFLVTEFGKPFSAKGFGQWFRKRCDEAGLPQCTAHGLRKSGATIAAEKGATPHELNAMFGWMTLKQAEVYTKMAEQKCLAASGMRRLSGRMRTRSGT
jgi:site-specific recombinase XerD